MGLRGTDPEMSSSCSRRSSNNSLGRRLPGQRPLPTWLTFYALLAYVAPNADLPPTKLATALQEAHKKDPVNFTSKPIVEWSEQMGGLIRMAFSKFVDRTSEPQRTRTWNASVVRLG